MNGDVSNSILKVKDLEVVYHHVSTAVQGVSFDVQDGEVFSV